MAIAATASFGSGCDRDAGRPNVLLLVMDTTRADRCSLYGYGRPTTPRLEEFARDAVVYDQAWTPGSWTGPSHASLFTGLRPEHHGFHVGARNHLDVSPATLAERLAAAGWETACFTNNPIVSPEYGLTRGFARYEALSSAPVGARRFLGAKETHDRAADWAEAVHRSGRPFFLFVNDMEMHGPYSPRPEFLGRHLRAGVGPDEVAAASAECAERSIAYSLGRHEFTERHVGVISDLYDACVAELDAEVGALLDRLRSGGLLDETVVVIASDHGEALGDHHVMGHGLTLHREIARVVLVVRWPGRFDGGRRVDSVVRLEDLPPTILSLCGVAPLEGIDGVSLTRDVGPRVAYAYQGASEGARAFLESRVPGADARRLAAGIESVVDGRHHYLRHTDGREELYDLARDPGERDDLAPRERATVERMGALIPR